MSQPRVRVAVIGLGVGEQHARAYGRDERSVLSLVYDHEPKRIRAVLLTLGEGAAAESYEAILADPTIEAVSIATYDDCHFQEVVQALEARKHVFVEKPLCRSLEELQAIKAAWSRAGGARLASNLVLRAAPLYMWLRDAIRTGLLGRIYAFDGEYLYGRVSKITEGWRKNVLDYSVMQGGGVHMVDLMLRLTGEKPKRVSAVGNRICTTGSDFRYEDFVAATYWFESGLIGRITANFGCVHRHQHVVRVYGTNGTFLYDDQGPRLHTDRDPQSPPVPVDLSPFPATKGDLIPGFLASIVDEAGSEEDAQHEFDVMAVTLAADAALSGLPTMEIEYV